MISEIARMNIENSITDVIAELKLDGHITKAQEMKLLGTLWWLDNIEIKNEETE